MNPMRLLFMAAVVNGVLAPPLVAIMTLLTSDPGLVGNRVSTPALRWLGWLTVAVTSAAEAAMATTFALEESS